MFCRHVFGNISGGFRGISRFLGNFAGFCRSVTARNIRSPVIIIVIIKIFSYKNCIKTFLNPLNPRINIWILICCTYSFPIRSSGEKLIKYQANSSGVIMPVILITTMFYKALILQGEIWCWSLLGLKGLKHFKKNSTIVFLVLI